MSLDIVIVAKRPLNLNLIPPVCAQLSHPSTPLLSFVTLPGGRCSSFAKYDLIAALLESERHQQRCHSLERLVGAAPTATKQQMRCDSCKYILQQLMGLKCSSKSSVPRHSPFYHQALGGMTTNGDPQFLLISVNFVIVYVLWLCSPETCSIRNYMFVLLHLVNIKR